MNEQEKKAWEKLVGTVDKNNPMGLSKAGYAILAADAELKRLREAVEWERERDALKKALESSQAECRGANYLISAIEKLFPNWKSYRDLDDCIRCELDALRAALKEGK